MSLKLKRVLAVLVLIALVFGWYVTLFGIGDKTKDDAITSVKSALKYGLDIDGGVYVVMEAKTDLTGDELKKLMEQTRAVLDNRVNQMGVAESSVTIEGNKRLRVEIPGMEDAEDAIKAIGKTAQLYFILADGSVVLDGSHVKDAQIATDGSYYKILLDFDSEGATLFEEGTRKAFNREVTSTIEGVESNQIAIVLDNEIVVHPNVNSVISGGSCEMTGNYTKEDASMTAALIRGGALPVELEEVQSSVQTATIGAHALDKSIVAGAIGLGIVFLLMLIFYGMLGLVADIALLLYVVMFLWSMVGLGLLAALDSLPSRSLSRLLAGLRHVADRRQTALFHQCLAPIAEAFENGHQSVAKCGRGIFHANRNFHIFLADDQSLFLQLAQRTCQYGVRYPVHFAAQLVVAQRAAIIQRADDLHLPLPADDRHRVAQRTFVQTRTFVMCL